MLLARKRNTKINIIFRLTMKTMKDVTMLHINFLLATYFLLHTHIYARTSTHTH